MKRFVFYRNEWPPSGWHLDFSPGSIAMAIFEASPHVDRVTIEEGRIREGGDETTRIAIRILPSAPMSNGEKRLVRDSGSMCIPAGCIVDWGEG